MTLPIERNWMFVQTRRWVSVYNLAPTLLRYGVMAAQSTLTASVLVQIQVPQPIFFFLFNKAFKEIFNLKIYAKIYAKLNRIKKLINNFVKENLSWLIYVCIINQRIHIV